MQTLDDPSRILKGIRLSGTYYDYSASKTRVQVHRTTSGDELLLECEALSSGTSVPERLIAILNRDGTLDVFEQPPRLSSTDASKDLSLALAEVLTEHPTYSLKLFYATVEPQAAGSTVVLERGLNDLGGLLVIRVKDDKAEIVSRGR